MLDKILFNLNAYKKKKIEFLHLSDIISNFQTKHIWNVLNSNVVFYYVNFLITIRIFYRPFECFKQNIFTNKENIFILKWILWGKVVVKFYQKFIFFFQGKLIIFPFSIFFVNSLFYVLNILWVYIFNKEWRNRTKDKI